MKDDFLKQILKKNKSEQINETRPSANIFEIIIVTRL